MQLRELKGCTCTTYVSNEQASKPSKYIYCWNQALHLDPRVFQAQYNRLGMATFVDYHHQKLLESCHELVVKNDIEGNLNV